MPNRYLKDSVRTSDNLNALSAEAERFFYRLFVTVDDYGRCEARPSIIRGQVFPLKEQEITSQHVAGWLADLQRAELISFYEAGDHLYLQFDKWTDHNTPRAKHSKCPDPIEFCGTSKSPMSADATDACR
jgi:hypothetical protein